MFLRLRAVLKERVRSCIACRSVLLFLFSTVSSLELSGTKVCASDIRALRLYPHTPYYSLLVWCAGLMVEGLVVQGLECRDSGCRGGFLRMQL